MNAPSATYQVPDPASCGVLVLPARDGAPEFTVPACQVMTYLSQPERDRTALMVALADTTTPALFPMTGPDDPHGPTLIPEAHRGPLRTLLLRQHPWSGTEYRTLTPGRLGPVTVTGLRDTQTVPATLVREARRAHGADLVAHLVPAGGVTTLVRPADRPRPGRSPALGTPSVLWRPPVDPREPRPFAAPGEPARQVHATGPDAGHWVLRVHGAWHVDLAVAPWYDREGLATLVAALDDPEQVLVTLALLAPDAAARVAAAPQSL